MQEIITYIIIGAAVTIAVMKTVKEFSHKQSKKHTGGPQNKQSKNEHLCSDCTAECILRNSIDSSDQENKSTLCKKIEIKSK